LISAFAHTLIIDQRHGLDLILAGCGCCTRDAHDPHIWLSPKLLKKQAIQIADALIELNPQHTEIFKENLSFLLAELEYLDQECDALMSTSAQKAILVSHPAFGYFCKDYGLEQLSIEMEGKDPTPRYVTELIAKARNRKIKKVFLQKQHNPKGGKRIAQELKAKLYDVDPYCENVIENLRNLAKWFSDEYH
jgi:zinc transport system substrate-binding protein